MGVSRGGAPEARKFSKILSKSNSKIGKFKKFSKILLKLLANCSKTRK